MTRPEDIAAAVASQRGEATRLVRFAGRCNNRCAFCGHGRAPAGGPPAPVDELLPPGGAGERLVFAGAEPTLSPALPRLVARAIALGHRDVRLWTNGRRLSYGPYAAALVQRGLTGVTVVLPGLDADAYAAATGVAEGYAQALSGLKQIQAASGGRCRSELLVPLEEETAIEALLPLARSHGVHALLLVETSSDAVFRQRLRPRLASLRVAAAEDEITVSVLDATGGVAEAAEFAGTDPRGPRPVTLPEISFSHVRTGRSGTLFPFEAVVYPTWRCNAACVFCPVDLQRPEPSDPAAHVAEAAARGVLRLTLCGGEPTLSPELPRLVARAHELGIPEVAIQTNGFALGEGALVSELRAAGLNLAIVSFHSIDAALSDELMGVAGSRDRTLTGVARLREAGVATIVHHVITAASLPSLPSLPAFLHDRFGSIPIGFSYAVRLPGTETPLELVAGYGEAVPRIREALRDAGKRGMPFGFLDCLNGLVPCVLPELGGRFGCILAPAVSRLESCQDEFVKPPICAECRWDARCMGLRLGYAERFGTSEIVPIR